LTNTSLRFCTQVQIFVEGAARGKTATPRVTKWLAEKNSHKKKKSYWKRKVSRQDFSGRSCIRGRLIPLDLDVGKTVGSGFGEVLVERERVYVL